jgi:hypothetical protein
VKKPVERYFALDDEVLPAIRIRELRRDAQVVVQTAADLRASSLSLASAARFQPPRVPDRSSHGRHDLGERPSGLLSIPAGEIAGCERALRSAAGVTRAASR